MTDSGGLAREAWWPAAETLISVSERGGDELDKDLLNRISIADLDVSTMGARWMADVLSN
jgi:hypothetical protein